MPLQPSGVESDPSMAMRASTEHACGDRRYLEAWGHLRLMAIGYGDWDRF